MRYVTHALTTLCPIALAIALCVVGLSGSTYAQNADTGALKPLQEIAFQGPQSPFDGLPSATGVVGSEPAALIGQVRCPEAPVDVAAASSHERHLACSAANDALQLLGRCGITLRRPLHVHIMSEVRHPFSGAIFGLFDPKRERVLVTQEANIPSLVRDTLYAELPRRAFYKSLIVHEIIHGAMHQNFKRQPTSHAAHEYPAYVLQLESLPSDVRSKFLQSISTRASPGEFVFSDTILFFDPFFFAASAYQHFKASGNGCTHLTALLQGEVAFIPTLR